MPEETVYSRRGDLKVGGLVADRYEIVSIIGEGGMGLVYKARHVLMNRYVALKIIRCELVANLTLMQRFQQEAQAVSKLQHLNIVTVYDFGVTPEGTPYLVMDYLNGRSLSDIIVENGRLHLDQATEIFIQACHALQHAHEKGIIHRDFKSSNLMICKDGHRVVVKVVDFGMAKLLRPDADDPQIQELTQTGEIFGSPLYMSPEQCRGQRLDERSDIYSMACVMYYALTGTPPFLGENVLDTLQRQIHDDPAPMDVDHCVQIPADFEAIIMKALRKNPENRYQNISEMLIDLEAVAAGRERVFVTDQMKKPVLREPSLRLKDMALLEASASQPSLPPPPPPLPPVRRARFFSHNWETNMTFVLLLGATTIAMTAYFTGKFVEEAGEVRGVNMWVERNQAGDNARQEHKLAEAEKQYKEAVSEAQKFGKSDPRLAKSLVSLGGTYIEEKKYVRAEVQLKRAKNVLEKCYGINCPELAMVMLMLARSYEEQGLKEEAAEAHKKAVSLLERSVGGRLAKKPIGKKGQRR